MDISQQLLVDRALEIVSGRFRAADSRVVRSTLTTYEEATKLLGFVKSDRLLLDTAVWIIELSGSFQRKGRPPLQEETLPIPTFTRAYVVLKASDSALMTLQAAKYVKCIFRR